MAELKKSEASIDDVWTRYNQIRHDANIFHQAIATDAMDVDGTSGRLPYVRPRKVLPPPPPPPPEEEEEKSASNADKGDKAEGEAEGEGKASPPTPPPPPPPIVIEEIDDSNDPEVPPNSTTPIFTTLEGVVTEVTALQQKLIDELLPKRDKFAKRLAEKDPITGNPRYGARTQVRVKYFLQLYYNLVQALSATLPSSDGGAGHDATISSASSMIQSLQEKYTKEQQEQDERERAEAQRKAKQEREDKEKLEREKREERERSEKERLEQEEEDRKAQEELHQQAEVARKERMEREAAERAWASKISVSKAGIEQQIARIRESTKDDEPAQYTALLALYQLFSQIQAHPENVQFRRIRVTHEQFQQDIGRHDGGKELLIAAGFVLGAIDEIPCFISKEPDIEKDMDAWSAWFDLQKTAFDLLQTERERIEEEKKITRRKLLAAQKK